MALDNNDDSGSVDQLIGEGGGTPTPTPTPTPAGEGGSEDAGSGGGGGDVPAEFLAQFPTETGEGEGASLQDWVKSLGVKDVASLAKIARDNQKALRENGRIKVPGEGATADEIAEYRKAIGVPDKPEDYARPEPKDASGNPVPYNTELTDRIFAEMHKLGVPKGVAEQLIATEIGQQLAEYDAAVKELQTKANAHINSWGAEKDAKLAQVNAALKDLGFTRADVDHMRAMPSGVEKFLDAMAKVGSNFTEDSLIKGDRKSFGMSPQQAQEELNAMKADPALAGKIMVPGSAERTRYERLLEAAAQGAAA
jgi:hypothetical protein